MASFLPAFEKTLIHEGGYVHDPDDPGGETYKGVARAMHPSWQGWVLIDASKLKREFPANLDNNKEITSSIQEFYRVQFWDKIKGNDIADQAVAMSVFDFAVNAGTTTACKLLQTVIGVTADGIIGKKTITALNAFNMELFLTSYMIAKIERYVDIVKRRPASKKYFYGWVCRALGRV